MLSSWNEESKKYIFSCITDSNFIIDNEHEIELELGNNVDYYLNTNAASFKIENQYSDKSVIGVSVINCLNNSFNQIELEEPIAPLSTGYARIQEGEYKIFLVYDDETKSIYHKYKLLNGIETDYISPNLIKISNFTNDVVGVLIDYFNCLDIAANTECLCEYFLKESGIVHVEINGLLVKNQSLDIPANNTSIASTFVYSDTGALLIHNDSDIVASGVYVVDSYSDTWGEDLHTIAQHGTRDIQLDSGNYKARIVDQDGNNEMIFNNIYISVNQITEITYTANR